MILSYSGCKLSVRLTGSNILIILIDPPKKPSERSSIEPCRFLVLEWLELFCQLIPILQNSHWFIWLINIPTNLSKRSFKYSIHPQSLCDFCWSFSARKQLRGPSDDFCYWSVGAEQSSQRTLGFPDLGPGKSDRCPVVEPSGESNIPCCTDRNLLHYNR